MPPVNPPADPTSDPDFMAAAPHEQMAYLAQTDPDFAKASPQDQLGYLMHIRGLSAKIAPPAGGPASQPTPQYSMLGDRPDQFPRGGKPANNAIPANAEGALSSGDQGYGNFMTGAGLATAAGLGAAAAGLTPAGVMAGLKNVGSAALKTLPYVVAGQAIDYARQNLPGGKYIPRGAEMIPLFMAGQEKAKEPAVNPAEAPELLQAKALEQGGKPISSPADALGRIRQGAAAPTDPAAIAADRYQVVNLAPEQNVPLPTPMKVPATQGVIPQTLAMEPAQSTTITQHGYDPGNQQMFVQFKNGNVYRYTGVPQEVYNSYRNSESQGSFHAQNIKGRYQTDLVGKVPAAKMTAGQKAKIALQSQALGGLQQ